MVLGSLKANLEDKHLSTIKGNTENKKSNFTEQKENHNMASMLLLYAYNNIICVH